MNSRRIMDYIAGFALATAGVVGCGRSNYDLEGLVVEETSVKTESIRGQVENPDGWRVYVISDKKGDNYVYSAVDTANIGDRVKAKCSTGFSPEAVVKGGGKDYGPSTGGIGRMESCDVIAHFTREQIMAEAPYNPQGTESGK